MGKLNDPRGQASHFRPLTPGLQVHRPVSISHIKLAEPNLLHLQAAKYRKNQYKKTTSIRNKCRGDKLIVVNKGKSYAPNYRAVRTRPALIRKPGINAL